jgi:hypothetical protein
MPPNLASEMIERKLEAISHVVPMTAVGPRKLLTNPIFTLLHAAAGSEPSASGAGQKHVNFPCMRMARGPYSGR